MQLLRDRVVRGLDLPLDRQRPVGFDVDAPRVADQAVAGQELPHAAPGGARRRHVLKRQVVEDRALVHVARNGGVEQQRLELARECHALPVVVIVERLDPDAIADEEQAAAVAVEQRERELAAQLVDEIVAVVLVQMEQQLGVPGAAQPVAAGHEGAAHVAPAVQLAVEHGPAGSVLVADGLMSRSSRAYDRESAVAKRHVSVGPETFVIRAPVPEQLGLARDELP